MLDGTNGSRSNGGTDADASKVNGQNLDSAIAKAKAKAEAKRKAGVTESAGGETATKVAKVESTATDEVAKAAAKAAKDAERAASKVKRDQERDQKRTERDAERSLKAEAKAAERANKKAHMSKVDKAAERLPELTSAARSFFEQATAALTSADLTAVAAHINHFNRAKATERALGAKLNVGDTVRIVGGNDTRYIGKTGTVTKAQRIRCFVEIPGVRKEIYLFTSDVETVTEAARKAS